MIRANCRQRFTAQDIEFIAETLAKDENSKKTLVQDLLTDSDSLDVILDDESLFNGIIEGQKLSRISPFLYFYILTRRALQENDIDNRDLSDYVSCMLAKFSSTQRAHNISPAHNKDYNYLVDIMQDAIAASSLEAFLLRSHLGNYSLFISGIFPDHVFYKSTYGRKAPGFEYYEQMGRNSYRWAAQHEIALTYSLVEILSTLAERFRAVRLALNQLSDNYIHLDTRPPGLDKMLRQLFFGGRNPDQFEA